MTTLLLQTAAGEDAAGKELEVPAGGLALTLRVPAVAPAHLELTQAELKLEALPGTVSLSGGASGLTVLTNLGPLSANWTEEQSKDVTWLTADWGARRALVGLTTSSTALAASKLARLKISDGGVWFPPLPVETVTLGGRQSLPDLAASRLMLEVVGAGTGNATTRLSELTVELASQPSDLTLRVDGQAPCYQRQGRLLPGQPVVIARELREALSVAMPRDGMAKDIPLLLDAALPGKVRLASVRLSSLTVHTKPDSGEVLLPLTWHGEAVGRVTVGAGARLAEVLLTLAPELLSERVLLDARPEDASSHAQLCTPGHSAAQGFPMLEQARLAGVDVLLRPTTAQVRGTLALHPDAQGRPGPQAYPGTLLDFQVEKAREETWISLSLPRPVQMKAAWWVVLTVNEGEALWPLGQGTPNLMKGPLPAMHRLGEGTWFPWEPPPEKPWGLCRLRLAEPPPRPPFQVELRRGSVRRAVVPDAQGRMAASSEDLRQLNATGADTLEVGVRSAGEPVAGGIRLPWLRVAVQNAPE
jgi:hypothetical protein